MDEGRPGVAAKEYIQANDLVRDSFALARRIFGSGYRPDVLLVLWRGGTPVGIVIHEFLLFKGVETYHAVVKAESYTGIDRRSELRVDGVDDVLDKLTADSRVLVIDDIFDSGNTMRRVVELLRQRTAHVRTATLYLRQGRAETDLRPDYYYRETDRWIVFPHELVGLTPDEIRAKDPVVADTVLD